MWAARAARSPRYIVIIKCLALVGVTREECDCRKGAFLILWGLQVFAEIVFSFVVRDQWASLSFMATRARTSSTRGADLH